MSALGSVKRWKLASVIGASGFAGVAGVSQSLEKASPVPSTPLVVAAASPYPGARHYVSRNIKSLPGGGKLYVYDVKGRTLEYPVPPKGFHPLAASAEQLAEYGFPPRPTDPAALAEWKSTWSAYRTTPVPDLWTVPPGHGIGGQPMQRASSGGVTSLGGVGVTVEPIPSGAQYTSNWSGYYAVPPYGATRYPFDFVQGTFMQPAGTSGLSCPGAEEAQWAGLGGEMNNSGLLQAGTNMDAVNHSNDTTTYNYTAWYEYLQGNGKGPNEIVLSKVKVHALDSIQVTVQYQKSSKSAFFAVIDQSDGQAQSLDVPNMAPYFAGNTAEFVSERPLGPKGYYPPLANFGSATWLSPLIAYWKNNSTPMVGHYLPHYKNNVPLVMTQNGGPPNVGPTNPNLVLAVPGQVSGNSASSLFTDYFGAACQ